MFTFNLKKFMEYMTKQGKLLCTAVGDMLADGLKKFQTEKRPMMEFCLWVSEVITEVTFGELLQFVENAKGGTLRAPFPKTTTILAKSIKAAELPGSYSDELGRYCVVINDITISCFVHGEDATYDVTADDKNGTNLQWESFRSPEEAIATMRRFINQYSAPPTDSLKLVLTCPQCGNSDWIRRDDGFECTACGEFTYPEDMSSIVEKRQKQKTKFAVTVVRTGVVFVEAESKEEAMDIANHQTTDTVGWSDDWNATDVTPDDSGRRYITEKAFD